MRRSRFRIVVASPGVLFRDGKWHIYLLDQSTIIAGSHKEQGSRKAAIRTARYLQKQLRIVAVEVM